MTIYEQLCQAEAELRVAQFALSLAMRSKDPYPVIERLAATAATCQQKVDALLDQRMDELEAEYLAEQALSPEEREAKKITEWTERLASHGMPALIELMGALQRDIRDGRMSPADPRVEIARAEIRRRAGADAPAAA